MIEPGPCIDCEDYVNHRCSLMMDNRLVNGELKQEPHYIHLPNAPFDYCPKCRDESDDAELLPCPFCDEPVELFTPIYCDDDKNCKRISHPLNGCVLSHGLECHYPKWKIFKLWNTRNCALTEKDE